MAVPAPRGALAPNEYEVLGVVTEFNPFVTYKEFVHGCMEFVLTMHQENTGSCVGVCQHTSLAPPCVDCKETLAKKVTNLGSAATPVYGTRQANYLAPACAGCNVRMKFSVGKLPNGEL